MTCKHAKLKIRYVREIFACEFLKSPFPHFLSYLHGTMFSRFTYLNETASLTSHVTKPFFGNLNNRRYIKKVAWDLFDFCCFNECYSYERLSICIKNTYQRNHLSNSSQQTMFLFSAFLHFAHLQDSSRSKTRKQEKVLCSMVRIFYDNALVQYILNFC